MAGERGRVKDDHVEAVVFFNGTLKVFHRIRANEFVLFGRQAVQRVIGFAALKAFTADIHIDNAGRSIGPAVNAERTGICKTIEDFAATRQICHQFSVPAHIKEQSAVKRIIQVYAEFYAVLLDDGLRGTVIQPDGGRECIGLRGGRGRPVFDNKIFGVKAIFDEFKDRRAVFVPFTFKYLGNKMTVVLFQDHAFQAIAKAIDQAQGVGDACKRLALYQRFL